MRVMLAILLAGCLTAPLACTNHDRIDQDYEWADEVSRLRQEIAAVQAELARLEAFMEQDARQTAAILRAHAELRLSLEYLRRELERRQ